MNINEPQLWFYEKYVPSIGEHLNDAEEYKQLVNLCKNDTRISATVLIDMWYRIYEIENTSQIIYSTMDNWPMPFNNTVEYGDNIEVDFGSDIVFNERCDNNIYEDFEGYALRFASPVTKIDPNLFNANINVVILPSTQNLSYTSSPDIMTNHLSIIKGYDVLDYTSLISKDNTLIVAATERRFIYRVPDIVTKIGVGAMKGSSAWEVIIPDNVKEIGDRAFDRSLIGAFFFLSDMVPTIGNAVFGDKINDEVMIYVPKKALRKYKKAWKPLKKHIKTMPKDFNMYAGEAFDTNSTYIIRSGLQVTNDHRIVNKNNRFINEGYLYSLTKEELFLWQRMLFKGNSIDDLVRLLYFENMGFMSYDDAYTYCVGVLKNWYEKGLICKY